MKVLIVAYYFPPHNSVGTKRPSYWQEKLIQNGVDSYVVTATPDSMAENVFYVAPGKKKWSLIKDEGINWKRPLSAFFSKNAIDFDIIVFTGGPFMHFGIIPFVKRLLPKAKVIIDFRDPFAYNPRFGNLPLKASIKRIFERKFIKSADFVITVNDYCAKLLKLDGNKYCIINNGYNEEIVDKIIKSSDTRIKKGGINFVYAGSFANDRNPSLFIDALTSFSRSHSVSFHHVGTPYPGFVSNDDFLVSHGLLGYEETISILKACDIGLIFTSGHPFESTTKVFDYMACGLELLIVSDTGMAVGSLQDITTRYEKTTWVKNDLESINGFLSKRLNCQAKDNDRKDVSEFSRAAGFEKLIQAFELLKEDTSI